MLLFFLTDYLLTFSDVSCCYIFFDVDMRLILVLLYFFTEFSDFHAFACLPDSCPESF